MVVVGHVWGLAGCTSADGVLRRLRGGAEEGRRRSMDCADEPSSSSSSSAACKHGCTRASRGAGLSLYKPPP